MLTWPAPQIPALPGHGGPVRVHDSTTGAPVVAASGPRATMYVCGITPYDATHLGHAATYIAFDLLNRAWRDAGHDVVLASNVTDVDDPLLERATATGVDWRDLAADQIALFAEDMTALGVIPPDVYESVVETIPGVRAAVETMLADGTAYRVPLEAGAGGDRPDLGDVYADLGADPAFGAVARLDDATMAALFAERGGDPARDGKKGALDPLLWRRERDGEPTWDGGTLGTGRPGWHVECAVIARDALGLPFDVQGGGADLLFPHHEMSTSHARVIDAGHGARTHVHAGLISYDGHKMSKSRGNLVLVSRLRAQGVDAAAIRLAVLSQHYRTEWEWTDAILAAGVARLDRWRDAVSGNGGPAAEETLAAVRAALADDLDAPRALAAVDAWADLALAPGRDTADDVEGAPGLVARTVDALLGVRF
ncbi:cysteinyl-tRNA synthetase [Sediminihabitans luteus]|uniref:L-cysteine:1D-myo-inositol 2-amino-2-deoxy-alpha-D-glucopyranoside ligase n=1 Tax=Sediminihabitans luteus TaxID=1138585 RepID=A0A2M9CR06_9CELL|nr:cysteine--1-D-myo-inosityl 2-amino-2-deoxy-alpha-D-glucopyranoside ligase [Sediminihabitans luteus]PJJ74370.1 cysteinyl-tRNA synthetase [Sediminihabitans luteus]GIJ00264.1 L-cysteine:1D-myo-inositol 2-amino-2-deoxy-alpha-D-glucopyranoside ligase [Sediminihabitans luteus]